MKLSSLSPEQKRNLLNELAKSAGLDRQWNWDSYDAIIPLCFKFWGDWFWIAMSDKATPSQLCDAVLIATGKCEL